jgi:hypothetical protein
VVQDVFPAVPLGKRTYFPEHSTILECFQNIFYSFTAGVDSLCRQTKHNCEEAADILFNGQQMADIRLFLLSTAENIYVLT